MEKKMKRFTVKCLDSITGMYMVLSECSYNQACSFLKDRATEYGKLINIKQLGRLTRLKYEKAEFFYDEGRGYLLLA